MRVGIEAVRPWLQARGGIRPDPKLDEVSGGGRSRFTRLHWRTTAAILIAIKLNDYGFGLNNGEAGDLAREISDGLAISDLDTTRRLIIVRRVRPGGRRQVKASLVPRIMLAEALSVPTIRDGFDGSAALVLDPIGLGRIIWRMTRRQVAEENANAG